jgi:hypothetical protein
MSFPVAQTIPYYTYIIVSFFSTYPQCKDVVFVPLVEDVNGIP